MKTIAVTHYYEMRKKTWFSASVSWINALDKLVAEGYDCHAFVSEYDKLEETVSRNGITWHFLPANSSGSYWVKQILGCDPRVVFENNLPTPSKLGDDVAKELRGKVPQILRMHFEPKIFLRGSSGILNLVDHIICPLDMHIKLLETKYQIPSSKLSWLPFGTETSTFCNKGLKRTIDFASSTDPHRKLKNYPLLSKVFDILTAKGYVTKNFLGIPHTTLADCLNEVKIFYFPSVTEASGSRILPESIYCGCIPVVDTLNETCCYLLDRLRAGYKIFSDTEFDLFKITKTKRDPEEIAEELIQIYKNPIFSPDLSFLSYYSFNHEISKLVVILKNFAD